MKINEIELVISDPFDRKTQEQYFGLRCALNYRENVLGFLQLIVYFKSADVLREEGVEISAEEIDKLLILEVLYCLSLFEQEKTSCARNMLNGFVDSWWNDNHTRFCRSFFPLIKAKGEDELAAMGRIMALLRG
ncbi:hypothetical protein H6761_03935 [Candidatus Nomurabacteria bacterium]|nr:hypothetical protein [Candidatus Nomurabacteria bacterium]